MNKNVKHQLAERGKFASNETHKTKTIMRSVRAQRIETERESV